jgi:hypothetical protein
MLGRREEKQGKPIRRPRPDANVQRLVRTEMRVKEVRCRMLFTKGASTVSY